MLIQTTKNKSAIVDDTDSDLQSIHWTAIEHRNTFYALCYEITGGKIKWKRMHRIIMERILGRELLDSERVDHKNRNGLDNRRENLRLATLSQNQQNTKIRKDNKSGYRGVSFNKQRQKWVAVIWVDKDRRHLGFFDTPELASETYEKVAKMEFGEFYMSPHT